MAAISWSTDITLYLATQNVNSTEASAIDVFVNRLTTLNAGVTKSPDLVQMLEAWTRPIIDIAKGTWAAGARPGSAAIVLEWIRANRPEYYSVGTTLDDVIYTDLFALIPSTPAATGVSLTTEVFARQVSGVLRRITYLMRHFATSGLQGSYVTELPTTSEGYKTDNTTTKIPGLPENQNF